MKFIKNEGFFLIAKKLTDQIAKMPDYLAKRFFSLVRRYRRLEAKETEIKQKKEKIKQKLIVFPTKYEGLTGIQTPDNLRTTLKFTADKPEWQRKPLRRVLGEAYPEIVHEDLKLTISLTGEKRQQELLYILERFFGTRKRFLTYVSQEWSLRVDEEALEKMIREKRIRLPKSAKKIKRQGFWSIITKTVKGKAKTK